MEIKDTLYLSVIILLKQREMLLQTGSCEVIHTDRILTEWPVKLLKFFFFFYIYIYLELQEGYLCKHLSKLIENKAVLLREYFPTNVFSGTQTCC